MAKADGSDAPARSDVYTGMLILSVICMLFGITVLALEADEYGWDAEPKAGPAITLPAPLAPVPTAPAGNAAATTRPADVAVAPAAPPVLAPLTPVTPISLPLAPSLPGN